MKQGIYKFLVVLAGFALILVNSVAGFADEMDDHSGHDHENFGPDVVEAIEDSLRAPGEAKLTEKEEFLQRLRDEFNLSKAEYKQILNQIADTKSRISRADEHAASLKDQLSALDDEMNVTTAKFLNAFRRVVEIENRMTVLFSEIEAREVAMAYQKELLKDYIRVIYKEENKILSFDSNGEINAFKLLLADGSVGENLRQITYFETLNVAGQQMVEKLDRLAGEMEEQQESLEAQRVELLEAQQSLEDEQVRLEEQKLAKEQLLTLTKGQEKVYSELLEQTLEQQERKLADLKSLSAALSYAEKKIEEEGAAFDPEEHLELLDVRTRALIEFQYSYEGGLDGFVWPIEPERGISAYFRDTGYVGVFGVQHNAIDIRAFQGTAVRSAADGVVYTTADNGYGYSYIIVSHGDQMMTVYGHMSEILVEEGQTVSAGTIIGLSGGMPGTKGAGYMTTGPHLHFEMLRAGVYVDPMNYLPLEFLTRAHIEALPEKYYDDWESAVLRDPVLR